MSTYQFQTEASMIQHFMIWYDIIYQHMPSWDEGEGWVLSGGSFDFISDYTIGLDTRQK